MTDDSREFESSEPSALAAPRQQAIEACWRSLVESAPAFVGVFDLDYRFQFANRAPGMENAEGLVGKDVLHFIPFDQRESVRALLDRVVDTRQLERVTVQGLSGRWYRASVGPVLEHGRLVSLVVVADDISQQKRAEEAQREQTTLLNQAESLTHLGSWVWQRDRDRMVWSDETYRLLGLAPQAVEPSLALYLERLHPDDRAEFERECVKYGRPPGGHTAERRVLLPDGQLRLLRVRGQTEFDAAGRPIKTLGTIQDVTDERRVEQMKSEFVSVVSHELRTPLTAVLGPLQMLARQGLPLSEADRQRLIAIALANAKRMARLVEDIFDYNRLETGMLTLHPEPCEAGALVRSACAAVASKAEAAGVEVVLDGEPARLLVDPERIVQVLTNLLDNAIAFSPSGAKVHVTTTALGRHVRFCVRDSGPGVPEAFQPAIFERFRQADASATRRKGGTGLGLAICKGIVEQHGGRIWLDSRPGAGATFCFVLPVAP